MAFPFPFPLFPIRILDIRDLVIVFPPVPIATVERALRRRVVGYPGFQAAAAAEGV